MKRRVIVPLGLAVFYLVFGFAASAGDLTSKKTVITVDQPMEIPGQKAVVLPPGTYVIRLLDHPGARHLVQFLSADETKVYATAFGVPEYRMVTPEKPEITFYEREVGRAHPIRSWVYPGNNYGLEFIYSKKPAEKSAATATTANSESAVTPSGVQ